MVLSFSKHAASTSVAKRRSCGSGLWIDRQSSIACFSQPIAGSVSRDANSAMYGIVALLSWR